MELYPNELVVESVLAKELDISRTPLREALTKLQHDNLVLKQSNGRLKVAPISVKEAKEIFQVRVQLEGIATREATELAGEADIDHLQMIVHSIEQTYKENNMEGVLFYGEKFHIYIYYLSKNDTVKNILLQLNNHIKRYRSLVPTNKISMTKDEGLEHRLIFEHIKKGEKYEAEKMMKKHIESSLEIAVMSIEAFKK